MKNRFYLACLRDNVGRNMAFHGVAGAGYSTNISKAQTFTREEAQRAWETGREFDQPISADHVDAASIYKVDSQYIPQESITPAGVEFFAAFRRQAWDGNDVFWLAKEGLALDFSQARRITRSELSSIPNTFIIVPHDVVDVQKRLTFDHGLFNPRTMVQGAGLVTPAHIQREKRRKSNGKTRWNCPTCGKISWQYDPYTFSGCLDRCCNDYRD